MKTPNLEVSIPPYTEDTSKVARKMSGEFAKASVVCEHKRIPKVDDANLEVSKVYRELFKIGMTYAVYTLCYTALKHFINAPRPFCSIPRDQVITIIKDIDSYNCFSSFPSAHTGMALLIGCFLWQYASFISKIFIIFIICITAISRITLAMHYPADIIYSIFITLGIFYLCNKFIPLLEQKLIQSKMIQSKIKVILNDS